MAKPATKPERRRISYAERIEGDWIIRTWNGGEQLLVISEPSPDAERRELLNALQSLPADWPESKPVLQGSMGIVDNVVFFNRETTPPVADKRKPYEHLRRSRW